MSSSDARAAPFAFGEAEARMAALAWIRRRWLASPSLARHARAGALESLWIPFWLIDARAVANWESTGVRGIVEMDFGALPVSAEAHADAALMEALEPWPVHALRLRDGCDMTGHAIAAEALTRAEALARARIRMERDLMATVRRSQSPSVSERARLLGVDYPRETCGISLLPLWRFDGLRFGRRWRVAVNGVTGKAAGRRMPG
jgi:hypothetical protein